MIWDAANDRPTHRITAHQAAVKALAWCPFQSNLLATGGGTADRTIKFHNTHTGGCWCRGWAEHGQGPVGARHVGCGIATCTASNTSPCLSYPALQGLSLTLLTLAARSARSSGTAMSASCSPLTVSGGWRVDLVALYTHLCPLQTCFSPPSCTLTTRLPPPPCLLPGLQPEPALPLEVPFHGKGC